MATHYVDNKHLYQVIIEHKKNIKQAEADGLPKPNIPNYVGQCILLIANRLSLKPNFVNYSYREEMISDGIENCISYFDNFDPEKSTNPFAYFTQIIYYAFLRRIQKEKKQMYIKHKSLENSMVFNLSSEQHDSDENEFVPKIEFDNDNMFDFIKTFEDNLDKKRVKRKQGLEKFFEEP